jgi:hypothetical protein
MKFTVKHAIVGGGLVLGALAISILARTMLPELVRYIKMKRM